MRDVFRFQQPGSFGWWRPCIADKWRSRSGASTASSSQRRRSWRRLRQRSIGRVRDVRSGSAAHDPVAFGGKIAATMRVVDGMTCCDDGRPALHAFMVNLRWRKPKASLYWGGDYTVMKCTNSCFRAVEKSCVSLPRNLPSKKARDRRLSGGGVRRLSGWKRKPFLGLAGSSEDSRGSLVGWLLLVATRWYSKLDSCKAESSMGWVGSWPTTIKRARYPFRLLNFYAYI